MAERMKISKAVKDEIKDWAWRAVKMTMQNRYEMETNLTQWDKNYEGKTLPKSFPWKGASSVHVPITKIACDAIYTRIINTIFATQPGLKVTARKEEDYPAAEAITDYYDYLLRKINYHKVFSDFVLNAIKYGTSFLKVYYNKVERKNKKGTYTLYNDPCIEVIDMIDMLIYPLTVSSLDKADIIGHRTKIPLHMVKYRENKGIYEKGSYKAVKDLTLKGAESRDPGAEQFRANQAKSEGIVPENRLNIMGISDVNTVAPGEIEVYELWLAFDIDDDGIAEDIRMVLEASTGTILTVEPAPYLFRPFHSIKYLPRGNRCYGIGIPEALESLQRAFNDLFNQIIDNGTLANIKCFKMKRNAAADKNNHEKYPGKTFIVDQMDDIQEFAIGDIKASAFNEIALLQQYSERLTGVVDYSLGRESDLVKSRATATGTVALIQEANNRFQTFINDVRDVSQDIALNIMSLHMEYRDIKKEIKAIGYEIPLNLSGKETLYDKFDFKWESSSLQVNRDQDKQNYMLLIQQLFPILNQMMQVSQVVANPQVPSALKDYVISTLNAFEELMRKLFKAFDMKDIEKLMPDIMNLQALVIEQEAQAQEAAIMAGGIAEQAGAAQDQMGMEQDEMAMQEDDMKFNEQLQKAGINPAEVDRAGGVPQGVA